MACRESTVILLLGTSGLLDYLKTKRGWFSRELESMPASSAIVVIMLIPQQDIDNVATRCKYDTSTWRYFDPGSTSDDVDNTLASVLDILEHCRLVEDRKSRSISGEQTDMNSSDDYTISSELSSSKPLPPLPPSTIL